jgi:hypothetical protein
VNGDVRRVVPIIINEGIEMTSYRIADIEGPSVFYREAANPANPTLVLLHGLAPAKQERRW